MEWMILPYKRYADFSGRSRRMEYWMFQLLTLIVIVVFTAFILAGLPRGAFSTEPGALEAEAMQPGPLMWVGFVLVGIWGLGTIIPALALVVRRLHDRDLSGWWYLGLILVSWIPLVGWIASMAFFVVTLMPGTPGPNRFGLDPKDPAQADVFT